MLPRPSPNVDDRPAGAAVEILLLHYTGMASAGAALERLCDPASGVSAHYLIDEDGSVMALVDEGRRAWHAGVAGWRRHRDVNAVSIGIELVNPGHEGGYRPFPPAQMAALVELARAILGRHPIPAWNVLGHSDVAPGRKADPGELFDWPGLAARGIGLWPGKAAPEAADPVRARRLFEAIGYRFDLPATGEADIVRAFQRRFRPARVDGRLDDETMGRVRVYAGLLEARGAPIS